MRSIAIVLALALAGCGGKPPPEPAEPATAAARAALARRVLGAEHPPPGALLDAHFLEERIGDDTLGPADYRTFLYLKVPPAQIGLWIRRFRAAEGAGAYAAPSRMPSWWLDVHRFAALEFYHPASLSHRIHGWLGVSRATGEIYLFTYTL